MDMSQPVGVAGASRDAPSRVAYLDYLKIALIILVVVHHMSIVYAARRPVLVLFELINQGYFMGLFFLISGYLTLASFDHKGPLGFVKGRLIRLGIPVLFYAFVLSPLAAFGSYLMGSSISGITAPITSWADYPRLVNVGLLWFAEMLLIFDLGYAAIRHFSKKPGSQPAAGRPFPGWKAIVAFVLLLAIASYLFRILVPLDVSKPILGFPTLAYLPQYLSFFALGIIGYRQNWLQQLTGAMGKWGFIAAAAATLTLFPVALGGKANFIGGGYWQSGMYALWDSILSVGLCLGFLTLFRHVFTREGRLGRILAPNTFAVYVLHAPLILPVAHLLRGLQVNDLLQFGLQVIIGVPLSFGVAWLVRRIPMVARIL
jgi:fucose 4-O-acetylase-like acetyltransferase